MHASAAVVPVQDTSLKASGAQWDNSSSAETSALGLQHEEWIKCSVHVLHGASPLQFQDMINLQLRGISPGEFN